MTISVTYSSSEGATQTVEGRVGQTVMDLAVAHGVPGIDGDCGGAMACGTCHVHVDPDWWEKTGAPTEFERSLLEVTLEPRPHSRLGCQIVLSPELDGLRVTVAQAQKV